MRFYIYRSNLLKVLAATAVVLLAALLVWACGLRDSSPEEAATPVTTVGPDPTAVREQALPGTSDAAATPLPSEGQFLYDAIWRGTVDEVRNALVARQHGKSMSQPERNNECKRLGRRTENRSCTPPFGGLNRKRCRYSVDAGADVDARDSDGDPLLYTAVWRAEPEKLQIFVDAGADVDARDSNGDPLLYTAVWRAEPEKVQILVDAGADVDAVDSDGNPLLYAAIWRDKLEALRILVVAGADVDSMDSDGDPLLYTAVWRDKPEAVKTLVEAGADVNARRANGESLLHVARWREHDEVEEILLAAGATE